MDLPSPVGQHHKEHCGVPCPPNKVESLESERWDFLHRSHKVQEVLRRGCPVQWFPPRVQEAYSCPQAQLLQEKHLIPVPSA